MEERENTTKRIEEEKKIDKLRFVVSKLIILGVVQGVNVEEKPVSNKNHEFQKNISKQEMPDDPIELATDQFLKIFEHPEREGFVLIALSC
jgi:hypothetical protein